MAVPREEPVMAKGAERPVVSYRAGASAPAGAGVVW
jgi:hypothetical protein